MESQAKLITRFAPSPTGFLHLGGTRTALFNYLYTRQKGGKLILRIEDTDRDRNKDEFVEGILKGLNWLELEFDETCRQSDNFPLHRKYLEKLIAEDKAYLSKEEIKKAGDREEVIRFRNPKKVVTFHDLIRGEIKTNTTDLGDFIIAKSLDEPIFHFSNVVDDLTSGVNLIIRGEDHIANTPRQILIWQALAERNLPEYTHIPLIFSKDKKKLSKREHGESVSLKYYEQRGYLKDAMLNFLAFLGWNPGGEQEIYSLQELINIFNIEKVQKSPAIFNLDKLNWYNHEYIKRQSADEQLSYIKKFLPESEKFGDTLLEKLRPVIVERLDYYGELREMADAHEFAYYLEAPKFEKPLKIIWKKSDIENTQTNLQDILEILEKSQNLILSETVNLENLWSEIYNLAEDRGRGDVLWPLRYALSGREKSPDPKFLLEVFGVRESAARVKKAIQELENLK